MGCMPGRHESWVAAERPRKMLEGAAVSLEAGIESQERQIRGDY
jgi:hypothetical protein